MAKSFNEGLAAVAEDSEWGKYGYIKPDGSYAIKPEFAQAFNFKNDFAIVTDNNMLVAIINKDGEYIKKTNYYLAGADINDYIRANITNVNSAVDPSNVKYGLITNQGIVIKPEYDGLPVCHDGFICVYKEDISKEPSKRTNSVVLNDGTVIKIDGTLQSVSEGIGLVEYEGKDGEYKGKKLFEFVTPQGKIYKSFKGTDGKEHLFLDAEPFSEGYAAVMINAYNSDISYYNQWGFLKKDGTWLVEPRYIRVRSFKNGVAPVKLNGLSYGYIKPDLSWFIKPVDTEELEKTEYEYVVNESKAILDKLINNSMSDYEKLYAIYKYVTETVDYDYSAYDLIPRISYSAYGALKYNRAVCDGYAQLMDTMLKLVGIESIIVGGDTDGGPHAWNLVKISDNYYHIDATWDPNNSEMLFFLRSDEFMSKSRTWNRDYYPVAPKDYN